jgi:hypothetical protein
VLVEDGAPPSMLSFKTMAIAASFGFDNNPANKLNLASGRCSPLLGSLHQTYTTTGGVAGFGASKVSAPTLVRSLPNKPLCPRKRPSTFDFGRCAESLCRIHSYYLYSWCILDAFLQYLRCIVCRSKNTMYCVCIFLVEGRFTLPSPWLISSAKGPIHDVNCRKQGLEDGAPDTLAVTRCATRLAELRVGCQAEADTHLLLVSTVPQGQQEGRRFPAGRVAGGRRSHD